jgi:hypothetical protein
MNSSFSGETALRKYLLGILGQQDCEQIEEELLSNEEFAKLIDLIEDEIIDEYVEGSLGIQDRQAVETYFLRPPSRQKKLKFARMLRSQLREETQVQAVPTIVLPMPYRRWLWVASGTMAAMLLLTASLGVYTAKLRRNLETEMAHNRKSQEDLARERALTALLEIQGEKLRNQIKTISANPQNNYFTLVLLPILTMGSRDSIPVFTPHPGATRLKIEIPLIDIPEQPYHVSLLGQDGKELWSRASVSPTGDQLAFPIPYSKWQTGDYSVVLTGTLDNLNPPKATYHFRVSQ